MLLVVKLNPSCADSCAEESVCQHAKQGEAVRQSQGHVLSIPWPPHQHHLPSPPARLGTTEMPLTFLLDFIRQIGTVRQTRATEHLPEKGENRHGDLPLGSVGIGEKPKKRVWNFPPRPQAHSPHGHSSSRFQCHIINDTFL